ncbi:MAG: Gfo/Idh/MocA family oxidoreductase [Victivallales bacterium]|jgi:predicted dehydrogenase|nr:Gfo/Idh/MocA family oxidoreductase [Victivallales bacterium]
MSKPSIRFATIGTNFVTTWLLDTAAQGSDLQYAATYSRSAARAREFAAKYKVESIYTDLNALACDPNIDAVYIASPNSLHFEQAALMLSHGKHVLCEKTITVNRSELAELLNIAASTQTVLLEAMRSSFDPGMQLIAQNLPKLGTIRRVSFQFCQYSSRYDKFKAGIVENAFNPDFAGGALMDLGVYCVHPMVQLFGKPDKIFADALFLKNRVDGAGTILGSWQCGMQAELLYSKITNSRVPSQIQGESGCMVIKEIANPYDVVIYYNDGRTESVVSRPYESNNMIYEIREWCRLIHEKAWDHPLNSRSLQALEIMDEARKQLGISFGN